jgi:hypothetical protein
MVAAYSISGDTPQSKTMALNVVWSRHNFILLILRLTRRAQN